MTNNVEMESGRASRWWTLHIVSISFLFLAYCFRPSSWFQQHVIRIQICVIYIYIHFGERRVKENTVWLSMGYFILIAPKGFRRKEKKAFYRHLQSVKISLTCSTVTLFSETGLLCTEIQPSKHQHYLPSRISWRVFLVDQTKERTMEDTSIIPSITLYLIVKGIV